ncbi:FAD linked oxidase domain protein [Desulfatibacillum aliphaticivorans]|uniref:FAD linked oxidase domain protein n=1 Tax=Desulfatibacillum aliphaticivorans TaxID=218208 RepID=B8FGF9_DESAL|nr:FAD-binding oxidoreductase [Desulfatibacillum aliphaticivorans]ACL04868.1 FAD linked oxidase domain protein [Desulfatibacillum aliphaticivorans]
MIRYNGWGDESVTMETAKKGLEMLKDAVGPGQPGEDCPLAKILAKVGASRLPEHSLLSREPMDRYTHAHGQSLPDWIAMRGGTLENFPDAVAYPTTSQEVEDVMEYAQENDCLVIPYGGGTSVVGHLNVPKSDRPVLSLSLERMTRLIDLDRYSSLANFEAGVRGVDLEAQLRALGYTLGHYPQSFEYSTLGGWVVTRSSGQQSMHFGRIDQLFLGGEMITPRGTMKLPVLPASAAGPDLRQLVLGSEGRMGVLTNASVKVQPLPEMDQVYGMIFPTWNHGVDAMRELASASLPLSMMRLSNPKETKTNLALSGHETQTKLLNQYLSMRGIDPEKACMALVGVIGSKKVARAGRSKAWSIAKKHRGVIIGKAMGESWEKKRFLIPYLRNTLWEHGYVVDTLETAVTWDKVTNLLQSIDGAVTDAMAGFDEKIHVFTHLSHIYPIGSSIYTSYVFRLGENPAQTYERFLALKSAASKEIVKAGGTITHQHGVGTDHKAYLPAEKGPLGMEILQDVVKLCDPDQRMNTGKLLD